MKKCKNFLATLIKLASHNSPSPDTSKNVKALVQDLLVRCFTSPGHSQGFNCIYLYSPESNCSSVFHQDAKIEPEEFTTRLQAELKSSPQPYLIPFLKVTPHSSLLLQYYYHYYCYCYCLYNCYKYSAVCYSIYICRRSIVDSTAPAVITHPGVLLLLLILLLLLQLLLMLHCLYWY